MTAESTRAFWFCARQELLLAGRSRFLVIFAVVFAGLALAVSSSGYILSGGTGFQTFARTAASLLELVLLVVPLAAIVIGVMALSPPAGEAELLFSQPVPRSAILLGKLVGLWLALGAAQAIGFGLSGFVLFASASAHGLAGFAGVVGAAMILTAMFLGLAAALTAGGASRLHVRNLSTALVVWFAAAIVFDIAVLGLASSFPSGTASRLLMVSAIVNPVDAVRTATLFSIEGTTAFGPASLAFLRFTGGEAGATLWLAASAVFWIVVPAVVGAIRVTRADL